MKKYILIMLISLIITGCGSNTANTATIIDKNTSKKDSNEYYDKEIYYNDEESNVISINEPNGRTDRTTVSLTETDTVNDISSITILVNKEYYLPKNYKPKNLVIPKIPFSFKYKDEKKYLRKEAAMAIEDMFKASKEAGLELYGVSGFRSYSRQQDIYNYNLKTKGYEHTNLYSAKPGHSEHQTGLAIDVSCPSIKYKLVDSFANTPEGKWLKENCSKYGFIIRYPKDKTDVTKYAYEPWHIRYVGVDVAEYIMNNGITLEEYYEEFNLSIELENSNENIDDSALDIQNVNEIEKNNLDNSTDNAPVIDNDGESIDIDGDVDLEEEITTEVPDDTIVDTPESTDINSIEPQPNNPVVNIEEQNTEHPSTEPVNQEINSPINIIP